MNIKGPHSVEVKRDSRWIYGDYYYDGEFVSTWVRANEQLFWVDTNGNFFTKEYDVPSEQATRLTQDEAVEFLKRKKTNEGPVS